DLSTSVPRYSRGARGEEGRPGRAALERGPRPVPGRRGHEGRPLGLLRGDRAGARPAPPRPAVHDEALARGDRRIELLPEAGAEGDAAVARDAPVHDAPARG